MEQQQQQQNSPTIFIAPDPPPFPAPPRTVDLSPLEFILAILAVIAIPALIYTFFFSIKCPPSPFRRRRSTSSSGHFSDDSHQITDEISNPTESKERVSSDLKYEKETHVKELGSECPVCLSVFTDGEEVKQLGVCKHSFHSSCIDLWLNSHSNCPVCRASVSTVNPPPPVKQSGSSSSTTSNTNTSNDFHQGLPDASNLV